MRSYTAYFISKVDQKIKEEIQEIDTIIQEKNSSDSLEDYLKFTENFTEKYYKISNLFSKNDIKETDEFKKLTEKLTEVREKVCDLLLNKYYSDLELLFNKNFNKEYSNFEDGDPSIRLVDFVKTCVTILDKSLLSLKARDPNFWSEQAPNGKKSQRENALLFSTIKKAKAFNSQFKQLNDKFSKKIGEVSYRLFLYKEEKRFNKFDEICTLQQKLTNKIKQLEATKEVQALLKSKILADKENLLPNSGNVGKNTRNLKIEM